MLFVIGLNSQLWHVVIMMMSMSVNSRVASLLNVSNKGELNIPYTGGGLYCATGAQSTHLP